MTDITANEQAAAGLAVDFWKLLRTSERMLGHLPQDKATRLGAQLRFSANRLEQHLEGMKLQLPTFEGETFGPELPVEAINADEFEGRVGLIIESAIEPAVILYGRVIQPARVIVKEGNVDVSGD